MAQEIRSWQPSTSLSPEQRKRKAMEILQYATSPQQATKAAKQLLGCFPHARPPDMETYAGAIAAVLAGYPLGVVEECCDPRTGLARSREFPPTVAVVVEWCDKRLLYHRQWAVYVPAKKTPEYDGRQFNADHRKTMLERLQGLMEPFRRKSQRQVAAE